MKSKYFFFAMTAMLLGSCTELSDTVRNDAVTDGTITMTASSGTAPVMRAADGQYTAATGFDGGETVKVWMDNGVNTPTTALYDVGTPYDGKSQLALHSGETALSYPLSEKGAVTLYGIYPATATAGTTHTVKYDQTNTAAGNSNYKASDLMYATEPVDWGSYPEKSGLRPNLSFRHQLCKLTLTLVKSADIGQITAVRMVNTKRSVPVSAVSSTAMTLGTPVSATGETAAEGNNQDVILLSSGETASDDEETYTYCCIFVPMKFRKDIIEVDAEGTTVYFSTAKTFVSGYNYQATVYLRKDVLTTTVTIENWTEEPFAGNFDYLDHTFATVATAPVLAGTQKYTGTAKSLLTAGTATNGTMKYAVTTKNNTNVAPALSSFSTTVPTATELGTYYVWYYVEGNTGYASTAKTLLGSVKIIEFHPGSFTINGVGDKVVFADGNLQAKWDGAKWTWSFAEHQWDYIGNAAGNTSINGNGSVNASNVTVDLFGWVGASNTTWSGTNGSGSTGEAAMHGISNSTTSNSASTYGEVIGETLKSDWGNVAITNGGDYTWRSLTSAEWTYLLNTRTTGGTVFGTARARYAHATINTEGTPVNGFILFPDGVNIDASEVTTAGTVNGTSAWATKCTSAQWSALEAIGCVFLPAAGYRRGNTVSNVGSNGRYNSSTATSVHESTRNHLYFGSGVLNPASMADRYFGYSVRLVRDAE